MLYYKEKNRWCDILMCKANNENTKEEEDTMTSISKPNTRAFMLKPDKVDKFMEKNSGSKVVMDRFYAHRPKDGVVTPLKGKNV